MNRRWEHYCTCYSIVVSVTFRMFSFASLLNQVWSITYFKQKLNVFRFLARIIYHLSWGRVIGSSELESLIEGSMLVEDFGLGAKTVFYALPLNNREVWLFEAVVQVVRRMINNSQTNRERRRSAEQKRNGKNSNQTEWLWEEAHRVNSHRSKKGSPFLWGPTSASLDEDRQTIQQRTWIMDTHKMEY